MALRALILAVASAIAVAVITGTARGDGAPVLGYQTSGAQAVSARGHTRYRAVPANTGTWVQRVTRDGRTLATAHLAGWFAVPVVAFDGSTGGLSADGRILVLARPRVRFPGRTSTLAVLATRPLRLRRAIRLRGDFSFDAVSPDGHWVYLIHYVKSSLASLPVYQVRALNTLTGRLLPRAIVDPRDGGEPMRGDPVTRANGPGGRWEYTLYDDNGRPFIHALDTARLTARCIDLPALLTNTFAGRLRVSDGGARLLVTLRGRVLGVIDTRTLTLVARPGARPVTHSGRRTAHKSSSSVPVLLFALIGAVAVLGAAGAARRQRQRGRRDLVENPLEARSQDMGGS